jgi:hypothetical protein
MPVLKPGLAVQISHRCAVIIHPSGLRLVSKGESNFMHARRMNAVSSLGIINVLLSSEGELWGGGVGF